jgi:hypothetical protein
MTRDQIITLQERIGTQADGFWGRKSVRACEEHLLHMMPKPNPWPKSDDRSMRAFYGRPGDEDNLSFIDVSGLGVEYLGKPVTRIRCHKKVADSLLKVLTNISNSPFKWVLAQYAGCYNNRPMRNGLRPSKHSWGAAIDLWPAENSLHRHWPTKALMPLGVMEAFASEGWTPAGAFWSRDAMHFEATQPY